MAIAERADYRASKRGKGAKQRERAREREREANKDGKGGATMQD